MDGSAFHGLTEALAIRDLDASDGPGEAAWRDFVLAHPEGTFFHLPQWRRIVGIYGYHAHYRCAMTPDLAGGERIVGVLPLMHVKSPLFGASLISTAFTVGGGILAETDAARDALAEDAKSLHARLGTRHVELRAERAMLEGWAVKDATYAGFRREMPQYEDARLKAIPRKKRADVRKAIKAAPKVDAEASVETFHALYAESLRNLGTPTHGLRWFRAIRKAFGDAVEISAVHGPDGPVAGLMSFYFKDQVLPYYGGAKPAARGLHAYDYMYWALMEHAVERGARIFDFGRSKFGTGAFDYKTYWGFEPTPLQYQYWLDGADMPDVNPDNPRYARFVRNWKRLPLPVANRLGPLLARQLA